MSTPQPKPQASYWDKVAEVFRPDNRAHEARIRAALKIVPKQPPTLKNHY